MVKRIILFGVLVSLLQVFLYYGIIILLWKMGKLFHTPIKTDFTWGLLVLYFIYIFAILTILQNCLIEIINKLKFTIIFFVIALSSHLLLCIGHYSIWPLKTMLFLIAGFTSLSIKFYIDYKVDKSKIINR